MTQDFIESAAFFVGLALLISCWRECRSAGEHSARHLGLRHLFTLGGIALALTLAVWTPPVTVAHSGLLALLLVVALGLGLDSVRLGRKASEAQHINAAHLRALTAASPDLLMVLDEDGRYLEIVAPDEQLLVAPADALLGQTIHQVLAAEDAARIQALIDRTLGTEHTESIQYSLPTPTGLRMFEGHARRIDARIGGKRAVSFLAREITERVNSELERRIAAIAFDSQQGMLITDATTRIVRVNQAFTNITGFAEADVLGKPTSLLRSGRHDAAFYEAMWQQLTSEGRWQGEVWNRRKNGDVFPEWLSINAVRDGEGSITHYVATLTDITERKAAENQLHHLAFHDALTGLPNRRLMFDRLRQSMVATARARHFGAMMLFDLDAFKDINDLHGHPIGDRLLCQIAQRLVDQLRACDTVARVGGDEFALVLEGFKGEEEEAATMIEHFGERVLSWLQEPFLIDGLTLRSTASMGVVMFSDARQEPAELVRRADIALYEAKQAGRNTLRFFDPRMQEAVNARLVLEDELRRGLERREFVIHLQPQVDADHRLLGAEALVRWQHPRRGLLAPGAFIHVAEHCGLIPQLDLQVLEMACQQLARWAGEPAMASLTLAVNLSAPLLYHAGFVEHLAQLLEDTGADPAKLKLELTESLLLDDIAKASTRMQALKARGLRFSLDDFGTGYSSLAYLHQLPMDQLKIDRSFVQAIDENGSLAIIRAICALARGLEIEVLAEGVETDRQRQLLIDNGCLHFQGYLFGRPMSEAAFAEFAQAGSAVSEPA